MASATIYPIVYFYLHFVVIHLITNLKEYTEKTFHNSVPSESVSFSHERIIEGTYF